MSSKYEKISISNKYGELEEIEELEESEEIKESEKIEELEDTEESNQKSLHFLERKWTLWYYDSSNKTSNNWLELLYKVYTIDSIENFWRLFNNISSPSELKLKDEYFLFVEGVNPEWESDDNIKGGKWTVEFNSKKYNNKINNLWEYLVAGIIGESLDGSDSVLGIQMAIKYNKYRLSIWTKNANDKESNLKIGNAIKKILSLDVKMSYLPHNDKLLLTNNSERSINVLYTV